MKAELRNKGIWHAEMSLAAWDEPRLKSADKVPPLEPGNVHLQRVFARETEAY